MRADANKLTNVIYANSSAASIEMPTKCNDIKEQYQPYKQLTPLTSVSQTSKNEIKPKIDIPSKYWQPLVCFICSFQNIPHKNLSNSEMICPHFRIKFELIRF